MMPSEHVLDHPSEHVDRGLHTAVEGALWSFAPLRTTHSIIRIAAKDGRVVLDGNVISDIMRALAGRLAASVPGVKTVDNRLVSDASIEAQAAQALVDAGQGQLVTERISLESRHGKIYLGGTLATPDKAGLESQLEAAVEAIQRVPGVSKVFNAVSVVEGAGEAPVEAAAQAVGSESAGAAADQVAIAERLRVWRERASSRGS